ncbi:plasmid mobilization protein [Campylobacter corcagiensis]|uniref:Mobilization protein n=1 Tax=Campylobacter corcagiensis TaxID=1448857 RepID=A0A7M1LDP5_9BACT|nr:hypothetical protein [Campylobacter corcagiensis]QKF65170.1 hypothetical protein CCORG_1327 [Campylobacter corcagiensis]QOQ86687.1 hypothetical protein IMC76_05520 [Campylobacter corcagiensis]
MLVRKISLRLDSKTFEKVKFKAALAGVNISEYIRHTLVSAKPPVHKFDKITIYKLSKVVSILNQVALTISSKEQLSSDYLLNILAEIYKLLDEIFKKIEGEKDVS